MVRVLNGLCAEAIALIAERKRRNDPEKLLRLFAFQTIFLCFVYILSIIFPTRFLIQFGLAQWYSALGS